MSQAILPDNLLAGCLFSDPPNVSDFSKLLVDKYGLPYQQAQTVIYQVALRLNSALFPPITKMELLLTEGCNLACGYCFEGKMPMRRKMPTHIAQSAIDLLFDYSQSQKNLHVTFFGGEPTANFDGIQQVTDYAEKRASFLGKSLTFGITTNGVLLTRPIIAYFAEHNIKVLLSLDGLKNSHNRFRTDKLGRGTFNQAMKAMKILKQVQPWIGIRMTVMPENVPSLFDDVLGLYELGVNQFIIAHATGINWSDSAMESYCKKLNKLFEWYKEERRDDLRIDHFEDKDEGSNFFGCQAGRDSISISPNGEISPCSKILALDNNHLLAKLGDVAHGLTYFCNRSELVSCSQLQEACEEKGIAADFKGGCFASNYEETRDLFQPSIQSYVFDKARQLSCS